MFLTENKTRTIPVYLFGADKGTRYINIQVCMSIHETLESITSVLSEEDDFYPTYQHGDIVEPWRGLFWQHTAVGWICITPEEASQRRYSSWSEDDWGKTWL